MRMLPQGYSVWGSLKETPAKSSGETAQPIAFDTQRSTVTETEEAGESMTLHY